MNQVRNILLPTDFSECAQKALAYVVKMMHQDETLHLVILHVEDQSASEVSDLLNKEYQKLPSHVQSRTQTTNRKGEMVETILNMQKEKGIDLVVMGTDGGKSSQPEAESNTSRLLHKADFPVLIVPHSTSEFKIEQIVLALDKKEIDDITTLGVLHDVARWFGAKVHVLTVNSSTDSESTGLSPNMDNLEYYLETLDYHFAFSNSDDIEAGITEYIDQHSIDLLAILPRTHAKKNAPSPGKLTRVLALHAHVPLLVID